jgi:hypothetical protein
MMIHPAGLYGGLKVGVAIFQQAAHELTIDRPTLTEAGIVAGLPHDLLPPGHRLSTNVGTLEKPSTLLRQGASEHDRLSSCGV